MNLTNSRVSIVGEIAGYFEFSHELYGEKFYTNIVKVDRESGNYDLVPIMVSERTLDVKEDWLGRCVKFMGRFSSYNSHEDGKSRLILSVFVQEYEVMDCVYHINCIEIDGYICKEPVYRITPLGREITDLMIAVNRPYGKSDYIPCILWGRNAKYSAKLSVGTHVKMEGRIQSREYRKKLADGTRGEEVRIAYEVSVSNIEEVAEEKE